jgi:hypothetical protein
MDAGTTIALITLLVTIIVSAVAGIRYLIEISLKIQHTTLVLNQGLEKLGVQMAHRDEELKRETEELRERVHFLDEKIRLQEEKLENQRKELSYLKKVLASYYPDKFQREGDLNG